MKKLLFLVFAASTFAYSQYTFTSPYLQHPEKAIGYVDSCAQFWIKAYAPAGGYYINLNRTGAINGNTNKNALNQSRDAYGFVRAFQLTGNEQYLEYARHGLDFMYASAWDNAYGGWINTINASGRPTNAAENKTAYYQHYAMLGITAYFEATRDTLDWQWLMKSYAYNDAKLWDSRAEKFGYYDNVKYDGTNPSAKSFNATVDAVTTHLLHLYLMTGDAAYKARLLQLCDNMINRLYESSKPLKMGFVELYDKDWNVDNTSQDANRTIMGHVLKTSWCLARVYEFTSDTAYLATAKRLTELVWQKGYDHQMGGPYKDYDRNTGVMMMYGNPDTCKAWWQMEQAITDGLMLYHITGAAQYAQMADESLNFFMNYFVDHTYGDVYADRTKYGKIAWNEDKGSDGKAAYHSIETGYYVYLYGNLLMNKTPATLYYYFIPDVVEKHYAMNPLTCTDPRIVIASVMQDGAEYPLVDKSNRIITVPAGAGGKFAVTYAIAGATDVASRSKQELPAEFALRQNYPNPFNPSTVIAFSLPSEARVTLAVYDMLGRCVATLVNNTMGPGEHQVTWNAQSLPSGVYIYRVHAGAWSASKKLILSK
jgi:mannose/cellobiose epimerase-like protein (N-acyl-D-glucosamine 2-epimerase family)